MGLSCMFSSGSDDFSPNPNKHRFEIKEIKKGKKLDIVIVKYHDCTTFNGIKVLLVESGFVTKSTKELDPHFFERGKIIARFKPTKDGIKMAEAIQKSMQG